MNNFEIIANDAINGGFITLEEVENRLANGDDLGFHTFNRWKKMGFVVKAGQKHLFKSRIWDQKYFDKLKKYRANGGDEENAPHMWKTDAYLFSREQVEELAKDNAKVKMAKGEVAKKTTRKAVEKPKAEKVAKTTRKTKKNTRKAEKVATKNVATEEPKKSAREIYESMEIGKPIVVSFERKRKNTRKTEKVAKATTKAPAKAKAEKVVAKTTKKAVKNTRNGKYSEDFYIVTKGKNGEKVATAVKGFKVKSKKCKGLFCRKDGIGKATRYTISDIKTGLYLRSDNKLSDLLAWVEKDETAQALTNARKNESYKENVDLLKKLIAKA